MVDGHGPWSDEYQDSVTLNQWTKLIHCTLLGSPGHQTYDYAALLEKGFTLRAVEYRTDCVPRHVSVADYNVRAEVLQLAAH
jgi:hypothetical protein